MNAQIATDLASKAEILIWLAVLVAAISGRVYRNYPGVLLFIGARLYLAAEYDWFAFAYPANDFTRHILIIRFWIYWSGYLFNVAGILLTIEQILRRVLTPLPGLSRLSVFIFRGTSGLALFIALTAHLPNIGQKKLQAWLDGLSFSFLLCMCVFELVLMLALLVYARRLGLSLRTRVLGLSAGLSLFSLADITSALGVWFVTTNTNAIDIEFCSESVAFLALFVWLAYFILPDQPRGPLLLKSTSTLMRWNEIVSQLGSGSGNQEPVVSFMSDVENVVERIMLRNTGRQD